MLKPNPITGLWLQPEKTPTELRNWFFELLPRELAVYNTAQIHFAYIFDLYDRDAYEPRIGAALVDLAEQTTDQNYLNHIRIFEFGLNHGLGKITYASAYALTYRLGHISVDKQDPEINLRILGFLNLLDVHSSDQ